ncbi:metallophosphoesterase [Bacteriovoracaceae bacterium]|nr:metallophosphoesterase [Bacteriovoracaceae bacterium]
MLILVVSDMHLGEGKFLPNGQHNYLEDFDEDERFEEFLEHFSSGVNYFKDVELILNGDIFNLLRPNKDHALPHILDEKFVVQMVEDIIVGHPIWFGAIRKFLARPNKKITYVIGNHDFGMIFPQAQLRVIEELHSEIEFTQQYFKSGVLIEHGHRFESFNTVPRLKQFIPGPEGRPILNLPWASLFCIYMLPILKKERPYFDKVRPISAYVKWTLVHDFGFFLKLAYLVIGYILKTQFKSYMKSNPNFKTKWKLLKQITIYPKYEKNAKRALAARANANVIVMGHTHISEWRKFADGRIYINSGTWNHIPSMDAGRFKNISHLTYVLVDVNEKNGHINRATLNSWHGRWRPFKEEVSLGL